MPISQKLDMIGKTETRFGITYQIKCHHIQDNKDCLTSVLGYEPAALTVHPPRTAEGGFIFLYRCLGFPKKCPRRKACDFRNY